MEAKVLKTPHADKAPVQQPAAPGSVVPQKSGLKKMNAGEILFHDGDPADSLYIIQKGSLRLYKPKGKGQVEIAVLRTGEVLGEMAYFDEDGSGKRRSCSAQAMVATEIIEITFFAFAKTMAGLNPWFKTIINTLATRLRKANGKIKELESNNVAVQYGAHGPGKGDFEFFRTVDIIKLLSLFFLVAKSHGEMKDGTMTIHFNTLNYYALEVFNVQEVKLEEFVALLQKMGQLTLANDKDNQPRIIVIRDLETLRAIFIFINSQRNTVDEKKTRVSFKSESFLDRVVETCMSMPDQHKQADLKINVGAILGAMKEKSSIGVEDLEDVMKCGFMQEPVVEKGNILTSVIAWEKLKRNYPCLKFVNAVKRYNETYKG